MKKSLVKKEKKEGIRISIGSNWKNKRRLEIR